MKSEISMKKLFGVLAVAGLLAACDNDGKSTGEKIDSLGERFERKAEQVWDSTKSTASEVWDSTKEKARDIKNNVEERLDRKDRDTTNH